MPWSRATLPEQAWTWRTYARRTQKYRQAYGERFHALRYEDLLAAPEATLRDVCAFLGTSFAPGMLGAPDRSPTQPFDAEREPWKAKSARQIDPTNRGKWRTQMPEAERAIVEWIDEPGQVAHADAGGGARHRRVDCGTVARHIRLPSPPLCRAARSSGAGPTAARNGRPSMGPAHDPQPADGPHASRYRRAAVDERLTRPVEHCGGRRV
jgi:hypothetical protein